MHVKIWGCRGSLASPGPETVGYGGNTSCVEVRLDDGSLVVLDAGTGIRTLGLQEMPSRIHLLLTHLHLDHLEGLGFFSALWRRDVEIIVYGPSSPLKSLEHRIEAYLSPPLFPVHLSDVPSRLTFRDAPEGEWSIGSAKLFSQHISHSGPTVGYRISEGDKSLAYMPDHEPFRGGVRDVDPAWLSGHAVAHGVDILLHDAQYTEIEYPSRVGWGHSAIDQVVAFARAAKVSKLMLFHHDPLHTDADLDSQLARARQLSEDDGFEVVAAHEGDIIF
ncbi:MAG: MBL fold metallo-hydrolase [Actinomycetota bacterium]